MQHLYAAVCNLVTTHLRSPSELEILNLIETPTWVFDVVRHGIWWGNDEAVAFWKCADLEALTQKDFSSDSETVRQRLRLKIDATRSGETVTDSWTIYPDDEPVNVVFRMRGVSIGTEERDALLIEVTEQNNADDYSSDHRRLAEAARYTTVMISYFSLSGAPIFRNPAAASTYGVHERFVEGQPIEQGNALQFEDQFCEPTDGREILSALNRGEHGSGDYRMNTVSGERWHAVNTRQARDPQSGDDVILVIEEDVSSRQAAQHEADRFRQQLEEAIAVMPDGFAYYDESDRLVLQNDRFIDLYQGIAPDLRIGMTFEELLRHSVARGDIIVDPNDTEEWIQTRIEHHKNPSGVIEQYLSDGRILEISERKSNDGGIVGIRRDVTEIREAEGALAESQALLVDAVESLGDAFILTDADDRIVIVNARYLEYYPDVAELIVPGARFEDVLRESVKRHMYADAEGREDEWIANRLSVRKQTNVAYEQLLTDGRWLRVLERRTASGGIAGSRVDITEIKKAQQAAEEASRAKSEFLSSMSHELRTPLNSILGFAQILAYDLRDTATDKQKRAIEMISNSGQHLLSLISDVLDLSSIESGRIQIMIEDVNLPPLVSDCLSVIDAMCRRKSIRIDNQVPDALINVQADPMRLKQILLNILSNAVKYNVIGGTVRVSCTVVDGDMLQVSVEDEGPGIHVDDFDAVFAPFDRLGREALNIEGSGVGLAISKTLIELIKGDIGFTSVFGKGSTFWIKIPLAKESTLSESHSYLK